jgi:hypothetical protein
MKPFEVLHTSPLVYRPTGALAYHKSEEEHVSRVSAISAMTVARRADNTPGFLVLSKLYNMEYEG